MFGQELPNQHRRTVKKFKKVKTVFISFKTFLDNLMMKINDLFSVSTGTQIF